MTIGKLFNCLLEDARIVNHVIYNKKEVLNNGTQQIESYWIAPLPKNHDWLLVSKESSGPYAMPQSLGLSSVEMIDVVETTLHCAPL